MAIGVRAMEVCYCFNDCQPDPASSFFLLASQVGILISLKNWKRYFSA